MELEKIIKFCSENGVLLDRDGLELIGLISDFGLVKKILLDFKNKFQKSFITKNLFIKNKEYFFNIIEDLPNNVMDNFYKALEENIDFSKENSVKVEDYEVLPKKITIDSFVDYFRFRFENMKEYVAGKKLKNLTSINKLTRDNSAVSIIGLVLDKREVKSGNILLEVEDLTGKIKVLLNKDRFFDLDENIVFDSVIAISGSGNGDIIFADEVFSPDIELKKKKNSNREEIVAFIGDMHIGGKGFLEDSFLEFIGFLNSGREDAKKIKYLFIVGDLVSGVGVYPDQEKTLKIKSIKDQYKKVYDLLSKVRRDIKIIISSGNHDGVRISEPQPKLNKKYAKSLYEMENVFMANNPSDVIIGKQEDFDGFRVLIYHGFSYIFYINNVSRFVLEKAFNNPEKLMKYVLKNRHIAPVYGSSLAYPNMEDKLIIKNIPDIFVSGHLHKSSIDYYNNILTISVSSWEPPIDYQKKMGICPDFCKVPIFNLKTRETKILDFEKRGEKGGN